LNWALLDGFRIRTAFAKTTNKDDNPNGNWKKETCIVPVTVAD
jgi:hypothetical protein